jgi:L-rhamnose mutarotase
MTSHAWVLGVQPGYEEEYKRRHCHLVGSGTH